MSNPYDDENDETFTSGMTIPEDVMEIYMEMQARVYEKHQGHPMFNHAMYSQTEQDFNDAYNAGYEMGIRVHGVFGTEIDINQNMVGVRNTIGIRYATGFASKAQAAGYRNYWNNEH